MLTNSNENNFFSSIQGTNSLPYIIEVPVEVMIYPTITEIPVEMNM